MIISLIMLFKNHILLGIISFLIFKDFLHGGNQIIFFSLILLGSIFPDIDERRSKMNQWSGFLGRMVTFFFQHRGIFHSLVLAGVISILMAFYWDSYYALGLFIGYFSHLAGDAVTLAGVRPFYPFSSFHLKGPLRVGGVWEKVVYLLLIVLIIKEFI